MWGKIRQIGATLAPWVRRRWWVALIVVALVLALGLGVALSLYQLSQTRPLMDQADALAAGEPRLVRQREILQFQVDNLAKIWTTIVQAIVGVVLATGAVATWRNLRVAQENLEEAKRKAAADREASEANLKVTHARLDSDREAQITNRFSQAIGQLGAQMTNGQPNLEVRLGGIYALEKIAQQEPEQYHWTIMEVLTAYVRQNAQPLSSSSSPLTVAESASLEWYPADAPQSQELPRIRTDIQAIMTVLGRRTVPQNPPEPGRLDLAGAILCRADLYKAKLAGANLAGTDLRAADLRADLHEATLNHANLGGADLRGANLHRAQLYKADLRWAILSGAILAGSNLIRANLFNVNSVTADQVRSATSYAEALLPPHVAQELETTRTKVVNRRARRGETA